MDGNLSSYLLANFLDEFCSSSHTLHSVPEVICRQSCTLSNRGSSQLCHPYNNDEKFSVSSSVSQTCALFPLGGVCQANCVGNVPPSTAVLDKKQVLAPAELMLSEETLPCSLTQSDNKTEVSRGRTTFGKISVDFHEEIPILGERILDIICTESSQGKMGLSSSYFSSDISHNLQTECPSSIKLELKSHATTETSVTSSNVTNLKQYTSRSSSDDSNLISQCVSSHGRGSNLSLPSSKKVYTCDVKMSSSEIHRTSKESNFDVILGKDERKKDNDGEVRIECGDSRTLKLKANSDNLARDRKRSKFEDDSSLPRQQELKRKELCGEKERVMTEESDQDFRASVELKAAVTQPTLNSGREQVQKARAVPVNDSTSNELARLKRTTNASETEFSSQFKCTPEPEFDKTARTEEGHNYCCQRQKSFSNVSRTEFESNEIVKEVQPLSKEVQPCLSKAEFCDEQQHDSSILIIQDTSIAPEEKIEIRGKDEEEKFSKKVSVPNHCDANNDSTQCAIQPENEKLCKTLPFESKEFRQRNLQNEYEEFEGNIYSESQVGNEGRDEHRDFEDDPFPSIVSSDSGVFAPICGSDRDDTFTNRSSVEVSSFSECEEFESLQSELLSSLTEANDVFTFSFNSPLSGKVFQDDVEAHQSSEIRSPFCTNNSTEEECVDVACQDRDHSKNFNESFDTSFTEKILNKISSLHSPDSVIDDNTNKKLFNNESKLVKCFKSNPCTEMTAERSRNNSMAVSKNYSGFFESEEKIQKNSDDRRDDCGQSSLVSPSRDRISSKEYPVVNASEKLHKSARPSTSSPSTAISIKQNTTQFDSSKMGVSNRCELDALADAAKLSEDLKNAIWRAMEKEEEIKARQARGAGEDKSDEEAEVRSKPSLTETSESSRRNVGMKLFNEAMGKCKRNSDSGSNKRKTDGSNKNLTARSNALDLSHSTKKTYEAMLKNIQTQQNFCKNNNVSAHNKSRNGLFELQRQLSMRKKISVGSMKEDSSSLLADYLRIQLRLSSLLSEVRTISKEARNSKNEFSSLQTRTNNICEERDDLLKLRDSILNV